MKRILALCPHLLKYRILAVTTTSEARVHCVTRLYRGHVGMWIIDALDRPNRD